LIALTVSAPALASPMIFAFEACACNRRRESRWFAADGVPPKYLPPFARIPSGYLFSNLERY